MGKASTVTTDLHIFKIPDIRGRPEIITMHRLQSRALVLYAVCRDPVLDFIRAVFGTTEDAIGFQSYHEGYFEAQCIPREVIPVEATCPAWIHDHCLFFLDGNELYINSTDNIAMRRHLARYYKVLPFPDAYALVQNLSMVTS